MATNLPNYRAVYRGHSSQSVDLYIAASLEEKLNSPSRAISSSAKKSVCIQFNRAYSAKYGRDLGFIEARFLEITRLRPKTAATILAAPSTARATKPDSRQCDDCFNCSELNDHHKCSSRNGCPLAIEWPSRR